MASKKSSAKKPMKKVKPKVSIVKTSITKVLKAIKAKPAPVAKAKVVAKAPVKGTAPVAKQKLVAKPAAPVLAPKKELKKPGKDSAKELLAKPSKGQAVVVEEAKPAAKAAKVLAPVKAADTKVDKKKKVIAVEVAGKSGKKFDAAGLKRRCREPGCEHDHTMAGYCRLHYIKNWRKVKRKEAILASGQLENYVDELVNKYPEKYLDVIRQDLSSEKDWSKVVSDLELDSAEDEFSAEDDADGFAEGSSGGGGARRERDFEDDDSDTF